MTCREGEVTKEDTEERQKAKEMVDGCSEGEVTEGETEEDQREGSWTRGKVK